MAQVIRDFMSKLVPWQKYSIGASVSAFLLYKARQYFVGPSADVLSPTAIANAKGKIVIITGGNSGIGKTAAWQLYEMGAHVILACRSKDKADEAISWIKQHAASKNKQASALGTVRKKTIIMCT